ncbi:MAG: DUF4224 domain-containing protein [Massilia sp.]
MISMFLSDDELRELTKRTHHSSQAKVLGSMGITFIQRPDSSLAVLRAHVEDVMSGAGAKTKRTKAPPEINWSGINAARA